MERDWTERYRPRTLDELAGHNKVREMLREWAKAWLKGTPKDKAMVFQGPPGVGKTTAALALAKEMGWAVVELNASDKRNAYAIKDIAERGALFDTFTDEGNFVSSKKGGHKLIIVDEADNLFGREDQGGSGAIVQLVKKTKQPVILIVNDYYELTRRSPPIKFMTKKVDFYKLRKASLINRLLEICEKEGIETDAATMDVIADNANGDLRSAIKDLQAMGMGREELRVKDLLALSYRDKDESIFDLLALIFKSDKTDLIREKTRSVDETPDNLLLWVDENLPKQSEKKEDLARGIYALSRADIFLSRVWKRQNYALWSYASQMMTEGVALAKEEKYRGYKKLAFPNWLKKMSRTKSMRWT